MARMIDGLVDRVGPIASLAFAVVALFAQGSLSPDLVAGLSIAATLVLVLAVFSSVHHAEVIADRVGEPFGTLVLTAAVTVIEVALILSIMLAGEGSATLTRDTVLAVLMIVCNGLVGLCIVVGGFRYGEPGFRVTGAISYLVVLMPLATLTLILPAFTVSEYGPYYSSKQLVFVSIATLVLYAVFLYVQTVRHRDYFLPGPVASEAAVETDHEPSNREAIDSALMLMVSLTAVVLLAKMLGKPITQLVVALGAPFAAVGLFVAMLVLLPESIAALKAARRNELQKSLNLALGSSLATIGMTIPAVGALSMYLGQPLALGLEARDIVLVVLTFAVSLATFASGRTNILPGFVHLVLFATFVFLVFAP